MSPRKIDHLTHYTEEDRVHQTPCWIWRGRIPKKGEVAPMSRDLTPVQQKAKDEGKKIRVSFRITPEALQLLDEMSEGRGVSNTAVLEQAIRVYAKGSK